MLRLLRPRSAERTNATRQAQRAGPLRTWPMRSASVAVGVLLLSAPSMAAAQTPQDAGAVLHQYADAINRGDATAAAALHASDAIVYSGACWPCVTPAVIQDDIDGDVRDHSHLTLHDVKNDGTTASARVEVTGDTTTTLGPIGVNHIMSTTRITVRDGKIVTRDDAYDFSDAATRRDGLLLSPSADDGQGLYAQSQATIVSFYALWGDRAGEAWVAQHTGHPLRLGDPGLPAPTPDLSADPATLVQRFIAAYNTGQASSVTPLLDANALVYQAGGCSPCLPAMFANQVRIDGKNHAHSTLTTLQVTGQTVTGQAEVTFDFLKDATPVGVSRLVYNVTFEVSGGLIQTMWSTLDLTDPQSRLYIRTQQVLAQDGQALSGQDPNTMASFVTLYGARAPDAWVEQHDARHAAG